MNRKTIRQAFLKSGQQLIEADQRWRQAQADIALAQRTRNLIAGLRAGDIPTDLGNSTAETWLLVWNHRTAPIDQHDASVPPEPPGACPTGPGGRAGCCPGPTSGAAGPPPASRLVGVNALIVPEIIKPQDRSQPVRQNPDGSTAWASRPFPADRLVEGVIRRYAEGRVEVGELAHAQTVPCRNCGQPALLVLVHTRDFDSDVANIRLWELCLNCPVAHFRVSGGPVGARESHPAFPYRDQ